MSLLLEPETSRADIEEALDHVNSLAKRCPAHFEAEWAKWHEQINQLLTDWQAAP